MRPAAVASNAAETLTKPLLDWLLLKYPETPKNRAKQWILAGRVSVRGTVIRKPHEAMADPGDALKLGSGMRPHFRARGVADSSARLTSLFGCGPGNSEQRAGTYLGAGCGSGFGTEHSGRFSRGKVEGTEPRRSGKNTAAGVSPA